MIVVLDTNILGADFWLKGLEFSKVFASNLHQLSATVYIPELLREKI